MKHALIVPALAVGLLLAGCTATPEPEALTCEQDETAAGRIEVAMVHGSSISGKYGLTESSENPGNYFVAAEYFPVEAAPEQNGIWYFEGLKTGQIYSVDDNAKDVSDWGHGETGDSASWTEDPAYTKALECLG